MTEIMKGVAGQDAANYNAQVADNTATATSYDTQAAIARSRSDARAAAGEAVAAEGGSGLQLGTGTLLDVVRESAVNSSLDAMTLRTRGVNAADAATATAGLDRATGQNALVAGIFNQGDKIAKAVAGGGG